MKKIEKIILEDNNNIHCVKFKLTFEPEDDDYDEDDEEETYFPDERDVEYALENSMLDQDNDYTVFKHKITNKKAVFIIIVTNDETNEYMPREDDIEHAMEYSGAIDEANMCIAETTSETISRAQYRDEKLDNLLS